MRAFSALLSIAVAACAVQDVAPASGKARFAAYPEPLVAAFRDACSAPAQRFDRPGPDLIECREYLPPEPTAALILQYDGTPEDLPQLVVRFRMRRDNPGYLVENDVFLNVPQKSGPALQVRRADSRFDRRLDDLYRRAGGVPE